MKYSGQHAAYENMCMSVAHAFKQMSVAHVFRNVFTSTLTVHGTAYITCTHALTRDQEQWSTADDWSSVINKLIFTLKITRTPVCIHCTEKGITV